MKEIFKINTLFSIASIVGSMWVVFKREWRVLVGATAVLLLVSVLTGGDTEKMPVLQKNIGILINIVIAYVYFGVIRITLHMIRGENYGWNDFKIKVKDIFNLVITMVLYSVIPLASMLVVGVGLKYGISLLFFVVICVPLLFILFLTYFVRFGMWVYFVLDRNYKPIDALKASFNATKGSTLHLMGFMILTLLAFVVGIIPGGLGLLVVFPMYLLCQGAIYERLSQHMLGESSEFPIEQPKELDAPISLETDIDIKTPDVGDEIK